MATTMASSSSSRNDNDDISVRTDQTTVPSSNRRRPSSTKVAEKSGLQITSSAAAARVAEHLSGVKTIMDIYGIGIYWGGFLFYLLCLANELPSLSLRNIRRGFENYADLAPLGIGSKSTWRMLDSHFDRIAFHLNHPSYSLATVSLLQSMYDNTQGKPPQGKSAAAPVAQHLNAIKTIMEQHGIGQHWAGFLSALIDLGNHFTTLTVNQFCGVFQVYADGAASSIPKSTWGQLDSHFDQIVFHLNHRPFILSTRSVLQSMYGHAQQQHPQETLAGNQPRGGLPGLDEDGSSPIIDHDGSSISPQSGSTTDHRIGHKMGPVPIDPSQQQQQQD